MLEEKQNLESTIKLLLQDRIKANNAILDAVKFIFPWDGFGFHLQQMIVEILRVPKIGDCSDPEINGLLRELEAIQEEAVMYADIYNRVTMEQLRDSAANRLRQLVVKDSFVAKIKRLLPQF